MELCGNGLEKGSKMYFFTPTDLAKNMLYYPVSAGEFLCNSEYCVERDSNNSVLVMYVQSGCIDYYAPMEHNTVNQGELLLIDCYKPHKYLSKNCAHTFWLHFDGADSIKLFEQIKNRYGHKIKCKNQSQSIIKSIVADIENHSNEFEISNKIYSLLCAVLAPDYNTESETVNPIETAKKYIKTNISKNLTVKEIAHYVHLSPSYFSYIFKENTGYTPYAYLLASRLEQSRQLLINTELSISQIAELIGFNSDANFICFFKKQTGTTPLKYRKNKQ